MKVNSINGLNRDGNYAVKNVSKNVSSPNIHKQIKELSNVYYKPVSFGRSEKEHKSWGAQIDPETKEASFKIFTYPDTKRVTVTVEKRDEDGELKFYELKNKGFGVFETESKIPAGEVSHGDRYYYTIYKGNGDVDTVKDPYSYRQETLLGESTIYDHSEYKWKDANWFKGNKKRISRLANKENGLTPVEAARIYELNIASLTNKGTFQSAKNAIKALPSMGFNAIEIMPVENTYSFNWGYDGVDKLAPSEHLGGPDGLKELIDYAHSQGINVIMDMVPNHLGPDGASLKKTGPYIKGSNQFGEAFNYEGDNSRYVRDYMVNAALNWVQNYHCDGIRLDMTRFMDSDYTMKQIAAEVNYHTPDAFLIAEDGREKVSVDQFGNYWQNADEPHDKRVVNTLFDFETGFGENEDIHCKAIEEISNSRANLGRLGFNSEWDFNYFHTLKDCLYGNVDLDKLEKASYCSQDRVKYIMSHDEIGNFEGSRLTAKLLVPILQLNENVVLDTKDKQRATALSEMKGQSYDDALNTVRFQKAQFLAEKLATLLLTGALDRYSTNQTTSKQWENAVDKAFRKDVIVPMGIKESSGLTYSRLQTMYNRSMNQMKMALARTYAIPGPKMVFQGDESADLTPFRFFRQFDSVKKESYLYTEKGYKPDRTALDKSTFGKINYSAQGRLLLNKFRNLTRDLNEITAKNPALIKGKLVPENTVKHYSSQVFATHAKDSESGNEIFAVTNFGESNYPREDAANYYIKFPEGKWIEILNTDDKKYGGSGNYNNAGSLISNGYDNSPLRLASQSTKIFKRVG